MHQFTNSQFEHSNEEQQEVNQSRFLIQQVNLEDQPSQQQVLERAEQLQIDDLLLARQSLTKELDPQWKPYCNRFGQIYYINFLERLAYLDHPIDMYFKKQYAKNNGLRIPIYKSFKLEQISQSMQLIQEQIRNYRQQSHKTTLRIVYQQPSQQEALSSKNPKSPLSNYDQGHSSVKEIKKEQQINEYQLQQLINFQKIAEEKYQEQFKKYKDQINTKLKNRQEQHLNTMNYLIQDKVSEACQKYEQEIKNKNKIDLIKQCQKLEIQYQQKKIEYCEGIQKFNIAFERLRQKQRSIQNIYRQKSSNQRINKVEQIKTSCEFERVKAFQKLRSKLITQLNQKFLQIHGNSKKYQQNLTNSLKQIYSQIDQIQRNRHLPSLVNKQKFRSKIFDKRRESQQRRYQQSIMSKNNKMKQQLQYEELKKQIRQLSLWGNDQQGFNIHKHQSQFGLLKRNSRSSLNNRLRMRII